MRKMLSNRWLVLCLLFGFILVVAMVASIPIYTDGILQRMLTKDLENYQLESGVYPGSYYVKTSFYQAFDNINRPEFIKYSQGKINNDMAGSIPLPVKSSAQVLTVDYLTSIPKSKNDKSFEKHITLKTISKLQDHVSIIHGRIFSPEKDDDIYEVIVTEEAMKKPGRSMLP
jgi:putative ABC transport system permease protein